MNNLTAPTPTSTVLDSPYRIPVAEADTRPNGNTIFGWLILENGSVHTGNAIPSGSGFKDRNGNTVTHWAPPRAHDPDWHPESE